MGGTSIGGEKMKHTCNTCYYNTGRHKTGCERFYELQENCGGWADEVEAKKRERAVSAYAFAEVKGILSEEQVKQRTASRAENLRKRNGKSVKEVLDEHFNWYYLQGKSDDEIAKEVHVDPSKVTDYRTSKDLPPWKKKTALLAQERLKA